MTGKSPSLMQPPLYRPRTESREFSPLEQEVLARSWALTQANPSSDSKGRKKPAPGRVVHGAGVSGGDCACAHACADGPGETGGG